MRRQGKVGTPNESGRAASNALPSKARSRAGLNWWRFMRTAPEEGSPKRLQRSKSMFQRQSREAYAFENNQPIMILPQVHLRKPCYDFYFLQAIEFDRLLGQQASCCQPARGRSEGLTEPLNR